VRGASIGALIRAQCRFRDVETPPGSFATKPMTETRWEANRKPPLAPLPDLSAGSRLGARLVGGLTGQAGAGEAFWWKRGGGGLWAWLAVGVALLFSIPVVTVVGQLLLPRTSDVWGHLAATVLPRYLWNTLWLILTVGVAVPVIGAGTAWLVTMCRFPGRRFFEWALVLPLAVPAYVMAYAYTDFLQFTGPVQTALRAGLDLAPRGYWFPEIRSLPGAAAMLALVTYPYVYLLARASFIEQSVCAMEVSRTLGCTPWQSFRRVSLPLARPSIAAGTALALMETLADFGTVSYFGVQTFTTGIVRTWTAFGDRVAAGQLAALLLGFVFLVLLLERYGRGRARYYQTSARYRDLPGYRLRGGRAAAATAACALPILLGFVLPAGILAGLALPKGGAGVPGFLDTARNSFTLAATTAALAVAVASVLAYGQRLRPSPVTFLANRVASLGYAIPGTVIAIGVLIPFAAADNVLDAFLRAQFGVSSGLLLTGGIAALVFAYLVRFMAVALNTVEASMGRIRPSLDDAARALGRGPLAVLLRVHLPLMAGSLATAALVVFVDVMKELPATLVMRPFNFDTLAVQAHNLAADERLGEAAVPALAIVAVGILPVILLSRTIARSRPGRR